MSEVIPVPLYRLYNATSHFYTTSAAERDNAVSQYGYVYEGIACYVLPDGTALSAYMGATRDMFAAAVISALAAQVHFDSTANEMRCSTDIAGQCRIAYQYADAMIAARGP